MNFKGNDYIPADLSVLKNGMKINYSIYRENNGEFLLLCKDVIINKELLERFERLTYPNYRIYIPGTRYEEIIEQTCRTQNKPKKNPFFKDYEQVKESTSNMFNTIVTLDTVPHEVADELAKTVHKQVETTDVMQIIQSINSVRMVDEMLHEHSVNVALLNGIIGKWLKLDSDNLEALVKVGLLHDIGKLKIPQGILNKPGKLTEEEFESIMNHPIYSHELLVKSGYNDERILKSVIQHHERVNGMGYPFGLNIDAITDFARITAISDVYEAMVAKRVYKEAHSPFEILSWFAEGFYLELDYKYVMVFIESMIEEFKGKKVLLSDGREGTIMLIHSMNIARPIVKSDDEIIYTTNELRCVEIIEE
jgi:HD-GYP domain-containing protein (c-di-GMP phosphodiesterase class II)